MKHFISAAFILLFCISYSSHAQGLNFEKGFNLAHDQAASKVVCDGPSTYMAYGMSNPGFSRFITITKLDTNGNEMWSQEIYPANAEIVNFENMVVAEDTAIYVSGWGRQTCDVASGFQFITKLNIDGKILWDKIWGGDDFPDAFLFYGHSSGFSVLNSGNLVVQQNHNSSPIANAFIFMIDPAGNQIDSIPCQEKDFEGFVEFGDDLLAYKSNTIWEISKEVLDTTISVVGDSFPSSIKNLISLDDIYFVLTEHGFYVLDNTLHATTSIQYELGVHNSNLKIYGNTIQHLKADSFAHNILTYDNQLTLLDQYSIPIVWNKDDRKDFSSSHFSYANAFELSQHQAIRFLDYSLSDTTNNDVFTTDIELSDIHIIDYSIEPYYNEPALFNVTMDLEVLIKNKGINKLNSCKINRYLGDNICFETYYSREFQDLNLSPGDSTWITLHPYASYSNYPRFLTGDSIQFDLCFYSSHPNKQTDLNVPNDQLCQKFSLHYVGNKNVRPVAVAVRPNPAQNYIKIIDLPEGHHTYQILNTQGQIVVNQHKLNRTTDISHLIKGIYFMLILNKDGSVSGVSKFSKM